MASLVPGLDSAYAPTLAEVQQAHKQGFRWWGVYIPVPNTDPLNPWTPAQIEVVLQGGIQPVPICIPNPNLVGDPVATARDAIAQARLAGLSPSISILYDGPNLRSSGSVTGPLWLPEPGPVPTSIGPMSAVQYGTGSIGSLGVDLNLASADFPFAAGLVCDFEHSIVEPPNNIPLDQALAWYQKFQAAFSDPPTPIQGDNMICVDPVTGGTWCVASEYGAVYAVGGAPYLGGTNNMAMNAAKYPCVGIGLRPNNDGYRIVLDWGNNPTGNRFRTYDFPRNGSGEVTTGTY